MKIVLACLGLLLALSPVRAQELGDVRIPVSDRSAEARSQAIGDALNQVLVRLTGDRASVNAAALAPLRRDPARWVQQFSYEAPDDRLALMVRFDVPVLMQQLERAAVPVWTTVRPDTLFWVVVQRSAGGEILSRSSTDPAAVSLNAAAAARGLPVRLPAMDGEDQGRIRAADVRGQFDQVLMQAAARYAAPFNVSAVIYPGASPQLRWRLLYQGRLEDSGQIDSASEDEAVAALVDRVTTLIASRYIVRPGQARPFRLRVSGVTSLDDWQAVTSHAARLAGISNLRVMAIAGSDLFLDLDFRGDILQLRALMGLDPGFVECGAAALADPSVTATLCWQGRARS
jgi:uncharacterized protein